LGDGKAGSELPHSKGEHKAKNNVCFLFAMVVVWAGRFQQVLYAGIFEQCSKLSGT
jgi:hypothetical protein